MKRIGKKCNPKIMRLQSAIILLSVSIIAASCSKSQYAMVEPDDLYFTHKDRKAAIGQTMVPTSPVVTTVEPTQVPAEYDGQRNAYSDQHSPVFDTPTYQTPTYGSPTIQQYGQKPYYDSSVNPDYLYQDEYVETEGTSSEYYDENYAYQAPPAYETPQVYERPQVNNYYYGMPNQGFRNSLWMSTGFGNVYQPFMRSFHYTANPFGWYDPFFDPWASPYWGSGYYAHNSWYDPYSFYNGAYGSFSLFSYCPTPYFYGNYGPTNVIVNTDTYYSDGTKIVTKPRQNRNRASYEVDKSNLPIKSRRADYVPASGENAGRVATNGRTGNDEGTRTGYSRRSSSPTTYVDNGTQQESQNGRYKTPVVVHENRTDTQKRTRTVVVPTRTRTSNNVDRSNSGQRERRTGNYNSNRSSVNRSGSTNQSKGTTRYSTQRTNANRSSSYSTRSNSNSRSRTSYGTRSNTNRSSGTRSSYSPSRSSNRSSSYRAPSRSSGSSGRSYSPSRSSSSRSSGTRSSSGRSSSRSSSSRKN